MISVGTAWEDLDGNTPATGATSANYTIDTKEPVISSVVMSDSNLKVGETSTLTITFSEAVTNFDNSDITLENGTLTAISTSDGGVTWTGTFTPTDDHRRHHQRDQRRHNADRLGRQRTAVGSEHQPTT